MKKVLLMLFVATATTSFSQTEENKNDECVFPENFIEPKTSKELMRWLKRWDATTDDLKKHIAVENDCKVEDVIMLNISEQKGNGMYKVCVKGKKMKYKRMGTVFMKNDENPFDVNKGK